MFRQDVSFSRFFEQQNMNDTLTVQKTESRDDFKAILLAYGIEIMIWYS